MNDQALKFLEAVSENSEIRDYLGKDRMTDGTEKADFLAQAASKFGYAVTGNELMEAFRFKQEELREAADEAERSIRDIPLEELDTAAGGVKGNDDCVSTWMEGENCWTLEACDLIFGAYIGNTCHRIHR